LKALRKFLVENVTELYVGLLLVAGIPLAAFFFFGWKVLFALTVLIQAVLGVLYIVRSGK